jgi:Fe2+ or Zn2+ uptake regulation protein
MAEKRETVQKKIIENAVNSTKAFFSAEELYKKIKKNHPSIGIATIYRFLKLMQNERKIHTYLCDRKNLYSKKEMNHSHFKCEKCGTTKHIQIDKADFLKHFKDSDVCHIQIEISGICDKCKLR